MLNCGCCPKRRNLSDRGLRYGSTIAAADLRDRLGNGRKVAIQPLEFLDRRGITLRDGDRRRIAPPADRAGTG